MEGTYTIRNDNLGARRQETGMPFLFGSSSIPSMNRILNVGNRFEVEVTEITDNNVVISGTVNGCILRGYMSITQRQQQNQIAFHQMPRYQHPVDHYRSGTSPGVNLVPNQNGAVQRAASHQALQQQQQLRNTMTQVLTNESPEAVQQLMGPPNAIPPRRNRPKSCAAREPFRVTIGPGYNVEERNVDGNFAQQGPGPSSRHFEEATGRVGVDNDNFSTEVFSNYLLQNEAPQYAETRDFLSNQNSSNELERRFLERVIHGSVEPSTEMPHQQLTVPSRAVPEVTRGPRSRKSAPQRVKNGSTTRNDVGPSDLTQPDVQERPAVSATVVVSEGSSLTQTLEKSGILTPAVKEQPQPKRKEYSAEALREARNSPRLVALVDSELFEAAREDAEKEAAKAKPEEPKKKPEEVVQKVKENSVKEKAPLVLKVSRKGETLTVVESRSSASSPASAVASKRKVADLRCPPEIAQQFNTAPEPHVVRRADAGFPPMMPRRVPNERRFGDDVYDYVEDEEEDNGDDDDDEDADFERKRKKKVPISKKKPVKKAPLEKQEKPVVIVQPETDPAPAYEPTDEENPLHLRLKAVVWAKWGLEPYWPGTIFNFQKEDDRVTAVVCWYGVDTYSVGISLAKIEPFVANFGRRYDRERVSTNYQCAVARAIAECRSDASGYFVGKISKAVHQELLTQHEFQLGPYEKPAKKRKRKSRGGPSKKKKVSSIANENEQGERQADQPGLSNVGSGPASENQFDGGDEENTADEADDEQPGPGYADEENEGGEHLGGSGNNTKMFGAEEARGLADESRGCQDPEEIQPIHEKSSDQPKQEAGLAFVDDEENDERASPRSPTL